MTRTVCQILMMKVIMMIHFILNKYKYIFVDFKLVFCTWWLVVFYLNYKAVVWTHFVSLVSSVPLIFVMVQYVKVQYMIFKNYASDSESHVDHAPNDVQIKILKPPSDTNDAQHTRCMMPVRIFNISSPLFCLCNNSLDFARLHEPLRSLLFLLHAFSINAMHRVCWTKWEGWTEKEKNIVKTHFRNIANHQIYFSWKTLNVSI